MKKSLLFMFVVLMFVSLAGCKKEEAAVDYTEEEIAGAIADISNDDDGNVLIKLADVNIDSIFENNNNVDIDIVIDMTKSLIDKIAQ
ncbi:MAG: hypothetical protein ACI32B_05015 [Erysipelotrichaceae bacterium]